jgi:glycine hydroxymethyltransferase
MIELVTAADPEVGQLIMEEERQLRETVDLIASENMPSRAALAAEGSLLAVRLGEGYIGDRECSGSETIDRVEALAAARAKALFGAEHANVQPISATIANLAVYLSVLQPGDTILSMDLSMGHLSHGNQKNLSGKLYRIFPYGVDSATGLLDYEEIRRIAYQVRPRLIIAGASNYPRRIEFQPFADIAREVGAHLMADVAHTAGLIVAGLHPSPVPHADFVTTSTHKTLRGPRGGGLILCRKEFARRIDEAVWPGIQGAPVMSVIASRAIVFREAMGEPFRKYQAQVLRNAQALATSLLQHGLRVWTGGTDNHLVILDLRGSQLSGAAAERILDSCGIFSSRVGLPEDPRREAGFSGVRFGSPMITTRGMKEREIQAIARLVAEALLRPDDQSGLSRIRMEVTKISKDFPLFSEEWVN